MLILLTDAPFTVLGAPGVAVSIGIAEMTPVLAALLVTVRDGNAHHLALGVGEQHGILCPNGIAASQEHYSDDNATRQDPRHVFSALIFSRRAHGGRPASSSPTMQS